MDNNLFAPPRALVADAITPGSESPKPKSVWLLQGLLAVLGASLSISLLATIAGLAQRVSSSGVFMAAWCAGVALVLAALVLTVAGCQRRRPYGRWLGALWIGLLLVAMVVRGVGGIVAGAQADDTPEVAAQCLAMLLLLAIVGFWLYRFGFSARARAWFGMVDSRQAPDAVARH